LEDLFSFCNRKFSMKTVLMLADQLLRRVEFIHGRNFLHRDIKPDNFLMGLGKRGNQLNVIDFGLAKRYRDPRTNAHIPYRENKNLTGTVRYTSINTHLGIEQSRRDDLESIGYMLVYFNKGNLPWQGLRGATKKQKYDKISEKKISISPEMLCKGLPNEFASYLSYVRGLRFEERPDYIWLRKMFRDLFIKLGYQYDGVFDWTVLRPDGTASIPANPIPAMPISSKSNFGDDPMGLGKSTSSGPGEMGGGWTVKQNSAHPGPAEDDDAWKKGGKSSIFERKSTKDKPAASAPSSAAAAAGVQEDKKPSRISALTSFLGKKDPSSKKPKEK